MPRDPYEVLGIGRDADESAIKKSFRKLARELHPDVNASETAEEDFKEAAEAYEVLSDPERRATFDRYGWEGLRSGGYAPPDFSGFGSLGDILGAFFGGGAAGGGGPAPGGDLLVQTEIELVDAARGVSVEVEYEAVARCEHCRGNGAEPGTPLRTCERCNGQGRLQAVTRTPFGQVMRTVVCDVCEGDGRVAEQPCGVCHGRGRELRRRTLGVDVPAGIADGQRIRVGGRGHEGEAGAPPGDLYVEVRVREDARFVRDGDDLVTVLDVAAPLAALGTRLDVPLLEGSEEVEIPAGTQPGEVLTLRGQGMPSLRGGRRGALQVVVNVVVPRRLDRRQRELLRAARRLDPAREPRLRRVDVLQAAPDRPRPRVIRLGVRVARAQAEEVLAELLELAPGGVEEVDVSPEVVEYAVYGAAGELPALPDLRAAAGGALVEVATSEVADDWSERWREFHRPVRAGELVVRAPWHDPVAPSDLVIDPGQAFGTGGHATTKLCLEALQELEPGGAFADLGCGSGVLAIAAARLGWAPVAALDFDPLAVEATAENARVNGVALDDVRRWDLRHEPAPVAPTIVANLLRPLLVELRLGEPLPATLIASGLLATEADEIAAHFEATWGLGETQRRVEGDWCALTLARFASRRAGD